MSQEFSRRGFLAGLTAGGTLLAAGTEPASADAVVSPGLDTVPLALASPVRLPRPLLPRRDPVRRRDSTAGTCAVATSAR